MAAGSQAGAGRLGSGIGLEHSLYSAVEALRRGDPVLIFDDPHREGETDMVVLSEKMTAEMVALLRHEAGGFLCVTAPAEVMERMGIGYQQDMLHELAEKRPAVGRLLPERLGYDRRSAFGLAVSHRDTFTGIPDRDRALTIRAVGEFVRDATTLSDGALTERFTHDFLAPGHVPMLHTARGLLQERAGHTELSGTLARLGGLTESVALMEMLSDDGGPLSPEAARRKAEEKGWPFVYGEEIREAWSKWFG